MNLFWHWRLPTIPAEPADLAVVCVVVLRTTPAGRATRCPTACGLCSSAPTRGDAGGVTRSV
eukprot:6234804-Pyramimonas_sp.AAC.1